jgi:hypothetical protein
MKRKFTLVLMVALCGLLSSCKKPISGQVFVVTEAGVNFHLGAVQVEVISAMDADDFMRQRQAKIESKSRSLQAAYDDAKTNCDAAKQAESQTQAAVTTAKNGQAWTNEPQYIALCREKAGNSQQEEVLGNAMEYLRSRYTVSVFVLSPDQRQKQAEAQNAIRQDSEKAEALNQRNIQITGECEAIKNNILAPLWQAHSKAADTFEQAQAKFNDAAAALKNFPTVNDYFDGFSPSPLETTVTDAEGDFIIQNPRAGTKVFAKAQRQTLDSVENYFWLVDFPATDGKFILSNNNMFAVPPTSP